MLRGPSPPGPRGGPPVPTSLPRKRRLSATPTAAARAWRSGRHTARRRGTKAPRRLTSAHPALLASLAPSSHILAVHDLASRFFRKGVHFFTSAYHEAVRGGGAHAFSHQHHRRGACRSRGTGVGVPAHTPAGPHRRHHGETKGILETRRESRIRRRDAEVPGGLVADRHCDLLPEPRPRRLVRFEGHRRSRVRRRAGDRPRRHAGLPRSPPPFAWAHLRVHPAAG